MIYHGDCLEILKTLPDNSVDSVVTDPPYGLSFMGKKWDYDVPSIEIWKECLRVLKPGGHLLSFAGSRTYHRMAVRIEDAGFEIRDMIAWIYASGFPKSLNVGKQVNKLETDEWSKISKAIDNIDQQSIMEVWKRNALFATIKLSKTIIEVGINTPKSDFAQDNAVLYFNVLNKQLNAIFAELQSKGLNLISEKHEIIAQENVEQSIIPSQNLVRYAVRLSNDQEAKHLRIFTAQCDVKEWLKENTMVNHKVDEALKTLRGNKKYSNEEITGVLCAVITNALKLTILSQSNTFQNLDTKSQMECASAISATITEYTAGNLISNTVAILKSKAVDKLQGNEREVVGKSNRHNSYAQSDIINPQGNGGIPDLTKGTSEWEGWGTALKPALEPITVARKPLIGTVAENVLTHGTGGLNIDGSRVGLNGEENPSINRRTSKPPVNNVWTDARSPESYAEERPSESLGRWPANLIHDGSEEVLECFPNTGSAKKARNGIKGGSIIHDGGCKVDVEGYWPADTGGSAARFFYCAKASKKDRDEGLEGNDVSNRPFEERKIAECAKCGNRGLRVGSGKQLTCGHTEIVYKDVEVRPAKNGHPTVKPTALMRYLVKLVTPPGGTVLDPFTGSGSTGKACKLEGFEFIGIEREEEYVKIAEARIEAVNQQPVLV